MVNNSILYRGYYFDRDLGLYYLISRYYDSNTGRFISPDDVSYLGANGDLNSYNLYAYCGNNPVMRADNGGEFWEEIGNWFEDAWEFVTVVIDSAINNFEADAGICVGMGVEIGNVELMQRADIVSVQVKDGELRMGHDGRAAAAISIGPISVGPQNDTFEDMQGKEDPVKETKFDIGWSVGGAKAFVAGYHWNVGFSYLGFVNDIASHYGWW